MSARACNSYHAEVTCGWKDQSCGGQKFSWLRILCSNIDAVPLWRSRRIEIQKKEMVAYSVQNQVRAPLYSRSSVLCSFECPSIAILLSHLRLVHSSDIRFLVCFGINSCAVTSRSFSSLYTHVYRHYPYAGIRQQSANSLSMELPIVCESDSHEDTFRCGTRTWWIPEWCTPPN